MTSKTRLYLIGTTHMDLEGYDRLKKLLNHLKPSVLGIEETREDFNENSKRNKAFSNSQFFEQALKNTQRYFPSANPKTIKSWLSSANFENRAIGEYSVSKNIPVICCENPKELAKIDFDGEARNPKSSLYQEVKEFLRLSPKEARLDISHEYSKAKYPVIDCAPLVNFYQTRDKFTEKILRTQKGNIAYICGLDHIYGDYRPNLYHRLRDLKPERIKLNKADTLNNIALSNISS